MSPSTEPTNGAWQEPRHPTRRADDRPSWFIRNLPLVSFALVVLGWAFGGGAFYAWTKSYMEKTDRLEQAILALPAVLEQTYMRKDVYTSDQRRLTEAIERLNATLAHTVADERQIERRLREQREQREEREERLRREGQRR